MHLSRPAFRILTLGLGTLVVSMLAGLAGRGVLPRAGAGGITPVAFEAVSPAQSLVSEGQAIFRFDTFGDEAFWGGQLQLHKAIAGEANGGVGPGVSPKTALEVGLKVDVDALPASVTDALSRNQVNLDDPATTLTLLKLNAVVGVKGLFDAQGNIQSIGINCALCHSTVDNSFAAGIGHRLDGWPNRDLNVGTIISLAPNLQPFADLLATDVATVKNVLAAWGPGKFDAELVLDGKGFRPDGKTSAVLIPPAFGLQGWSLHTWTGFGSIPYWNAFVAILEMHGSGTFFDPRLNNPDKFPVAVRAREFDVRGQPDLVTSKLPALHQYQLSLAAPTPPPGSFDPAAAARGQVLFNGKARCSTCHVPPLFSEPGWPMHNPADVGIDGFQSSRSPEDRYRTAPLKGLWTHMKGGFYHDGRFQSLRELMTFYQNLFNLGLVDPEIDDLIEYLKSI